MGKYVLLILSTILFVILSNPAWAGEEPPELKVKVNGTVQWWGSFAQTDTLANNQLGFGLRRVRGRVKANYGKNIVGFVQYEATSFKLLDARIEYHFSPNVQLRVGRFIGAGMRGGGLTSHTKLDIIERPASAQWWGRMTVGADYRDYGAEIMGTAGDFTGRLWVHNGNGATNIKPSHRTTASTQNESIAFDVMGIAKPKSVKGLEAGAHFGSGNSDFGKDYTNYSAYVYFEPKPIRFKAELVSVTQNDLKGAGVDQTFMGYYAFGAFRVNPNFELLGRYEVVDLDTDVDNNEQTDITFGASYSFWPSKWIASKISAAYVIQSEGDALADSDNNLFYILGQIVF